VVDTGVDGRPLAHPTINDRGQREGSEMTHELSIVTNDHTVEVVDEALQSWIVRFEPYLDVATAPEWSRSAAVGVAVGLVEAIPGLAEAIGTRGAMRVVFSPEVRRALAHGSLRLMGDRGLPIAVNHTGQIVEIAKVAGAGAGAGAAVGLGAAAVVAWPVVLASGVATAAAVAHQRWLEQTFAGLADQLDRIETRLRDDDLGTLDAADALVDLAAGFGFDGLPQQIREELAVARRQVDGIYFSRRRFVERFKRAVEEQQVVHEAKAGERRAWVGDIVSQLAAGAAVDEMIVFVRAMVGRARLGVVTARVLAADCAPLAALTLLEGIEEGVRHDYGDLSRRLSALARSTPEAPIWRRLLKPADAERAADNARMLSLALTSAVGDRLPARDEPLVLDVPAEWAA
jgi:hypothetical protein